MAEPAILALEDGTVFKGISVGAEGRTLGEVVFNTAMTGYQEILTDPSYYRQIVTLTYPHIGNYGVSPEDVESKKVFAAGLVIKDLPLLASNFRKAMTLPQYLQREGTVAIANIDTRRLTRVLRTTGAQNVTIYLASLDGKDRKRLVNSRQAGAYAPPAAGSETGHLLFLRDSTLMAQPLNARRFEPAGEPFPVP